MMPFPNKFSQWSAAAGLGMFLTTGGAFAQQSPDGWNPYATYPANGTGYVSPAGHKCATPRVYHPHVVPTHPGQQMIPGTQTPYMQPPVTQDPSMPPVAPPTTLDPSMPPVAPTPSTQDPMTPPSPQDPMTPAPMPQDPMTPPSPQDPMTPPQTQDPATPQAQTPAPQAPAQQPLNLSFDSGLAAGGNEVAFNAAPPMQGNLLRAYRGITFQYLLSGDLAPTNQSGTVNFRNTKVSENNLAVPVDRLAFRYQYFRNALDVDGLGFTGETTTGATIDRIDAANAAGVGDVPGNQDGQFVLDTVSGREFQLVGPASRSHDVHLYTFDLEKTFLDGLASVQVRVPFADTLASSQNFVSGTPGEAVNDIRFQDTRFAGSTIAPATAGINPTPDQTLGFTDVEFQDIQLILKGILYQSADRRMTVSGGLGVTAPTGPDLSVRVVDFTNDDPVFNRGNGTGNDLAFPLFGTTNQVPAVVQGFFPVAIDQRTRTFDIENETWGVSPFLAMTSVPTDRVYFNAFWQVDVPVNSSSWRYTESDLDLQGVDGIAGTADDNFEQVFPEDRVRTGEIDDQVLMHFDIGGGYWHYRDPCAKYITGLASLLELHYTTTLNDADVITVDSTPIRDSALDRQGNVQSFERAPRIGNIGNRVDILDLSVGAHTLIGSNMLLTTGYNMPLRDDEFDRTFDGEFSVILNVFR